VAAVASAEEEQVVAGKIPLTEEQLKHLEKVIVELEKKTSGEIRLMIVERSTSASRVLPTLFAVLATAALIIVWLERHMLIWAAQWWLLPAILAGAAALAWVLAKLPFVIRLVLPAGDLRKKALIRAELEFYREGLAATRDQTGILLFLSLLEHQAVVLADKGIAAKLDSKIWKEVVETMLEGPKTGRWAESLEKALRQCGTVLATHFPIREGDHNELSNLVIVKP